MRNRSRATIASISMSALLLVGAYAGPANAAPDDTAVSTVQAAPKAEAAPLEAQPGSLFYEVDRASSTAKKVELLQEAGFTETSDVLDGLTYERTEGGMTLGYVVEPPVLTGEGKEAGTTGRVGWDSAGPYVAATLNEWKQWLSEGTIVAGVGCGFITLAFGAAACGVAAGVIGSRINNLDTGTIGNTCFAYRGQYSAFLPYPGAC